MSDYNTTTDGTKNNGVSGPMPAGMSDSEAAAAQETQMAQEAISEAAKPIAMAISNVQSSACKKFTENAKKVAKQACDELKGD
jgi:predicted NBD/HSP70 family sugar kinase